MPLALTPFSTNQPTGWRGIAEGVVKYDKILPTRSKILTQWHEDYGWYYPPNVPPYKDLSFSRAGPSGQRTLPVLMRTGGHRRNRIINTGIRCIMKDKSPPLYLDSRQIRFIRTPLLRGTTGVVNRESTWSLPGKARPDGKIRLKSLGEAWN